MHSCIYIYVACAYVCIHGETEHDHHYMYAHMHLNSWRFPRCEPKKTKTRTSIHLNFCRRKQKMRMRGVRGSTTNAAGNLQEKLLRNLLEISNQQDNNVSDCAIMFTPFIDYAWLLSSVCTHRRMHASAFFVLIKHHHMWSKYAHARIT
jgi:hypothetical protein